MKRLKINHSKDNLSDACGLTRQEKDVIDLIVKSISDWMDKCTKESELIEKIEMELVKNEFDIRACSVLVWVIYHVSITAIQMNIDKGTSKEL